jgi:hypothetical protein
MKVALLALGLGQGPADQRQQALRMLSTAWRMDEQAVAVASGAADGRLEKQASASGRGTVRC